MSLKIINSHTQQFKCVEMCHKKSRWKTTSAFLCSEENRKIYRCQAANNLGIIKLSESEFIHFLYCIFIFFLPHFSTGATMRNRRKSAGAFKIQNTISKADLHTRYIYLSIWSRADNGSDGIVYTNLDFCWWDQAIINTICVNGAEVPIAPNYPKLKWYVWRGGFLYKINVRGQWNMCNLYIYKIPFL